MKHSLASLLVPGLVMSAVAASACIAADAQSGDTAGRSVEAASTAAAKGADFDSLVRTLKGRWSTLVYEGESATGTPDHGDQVWRTGLGGSILIEEEHIAQHGSDVYVLALHWWDRSTNSLQGMLCNNSGSGACNVDSYYRSKLDWDGKRLSVDLVFPQGAKLMLWHEVFRDFTGKTYLQTGDIGEVGGPLKRVVTIRATRTGPG